MKIIRYKLIKPEFEKAALAIAGLTAWRIKGLFMKDSEVYKKLNAAGVLDIWFEEIVEFKVGDWVYAEKASNADFRDKQYIPIFQIKEITDSNWLRPVKDLATGVHVDPCRLATQEEIDNYKSSQKTFEFKVGDIIMFDGNQRKNGPYQLAEKRQGGFWDTNKCFRNTTDDGYRYATADEIEGFEILSINGIKPVFSGDFVSFGDTTYVKTEIDNLVKFLNKSKAGIQFEEAFRAINAYFKK